MGNQTFLLYPILMKEIQKLITMSIYNTQMLKLSWQRNVNKLMNINEPMAV